MCDIRNVAQETGTFTLQPIDVTQIRQAEESSEDSRASKMSGVDSDKNNIDDVDIIVLGLL